MTDNHDPLDFDLMPAGLDQQGRYPTRKFPDTIPTDYAELVDPPQLVSRAYSMRRLCGLCIASWAIPVALLAIVSSCAG